MRHEIKILIIAFYAGNDYDQIPSNDKNERRVG